MAPETKKQLERKLAQVMRLLHKSYLTGWKHFVQIGDIREVSCSDLETYATMLGSAIREQVSPELVPVLLAVKLPEE